MVKVKILRVRSIIIHEDEILAKKMLAISYDRDSWSCQRVGVRSVLGNFSGSETLCKTDLSEM